MVAIVSVETLLLVLLLVLVAGLLRSHAAILRRIGPLGDDDALAGRFAEAPALPEPHAVSARHRSSAPAISGLTPGGDAVKLDFEGRTDSATLLAFLGTGCATCETFWAGPGSERLPANVRTVIVTRGEDRESPSRLRRMAAGDVPVVMSNDAFDDYGVSGTPYFVLVAGSVRGAGVATSWRALVSLVAEAVADARESAGEPASPGARTIDETLAAAGIGPEHASLYPSRGGRQDDWPPAS
jgi:hypothetical protein